MEGHLSLGPPLDYAPSALRCLDLDRIDHSTIMPWDSFLGRSARPMRSQVDGGAYHGYGTPPTHPPGKVHCYGGSTTLGYGADPHIPLI
jgi:hypothetical protein